MQLLFQGVYQVDLGGEPAQQLPVRRLTHLHPRLQLQHLALHSALPNLTAATGALTRFMINCLLELRPMKSMTDSTKELSQQAL